MNILEDYNLSEIASILEISKEELIEISLIQFLKLKSSECEQKLGKLHFENHSLQKKYKMRLNELKKALESLELLEDYDNQTIEGVSVFEAVSDTRRWEHILENLEKERLKLQRIKELTKSRSGV